MTAEEVKELAGRVLRPVLGNENVERIDVREEDDWSGDSSLYIDVFVIPGFSSFDFEDWAKSKFELAKALLDKHESRFPYVRIRDESEERDDYDGSERDGV